MDLNLKRTGAAPPPPMEDLTFALHALAVIEVHSEQGDVKGKKTIRQIAHCDSYLCHRENSLLFSLMCAFGQHAVPVFEKYLTTYNKPVEYSEMSAEIRRRMSKDV